MDKEREDLANFISMITQDKTPFMSSISKEKATTIYHEWQTDMLEGKNNSSKAWAVENNNTRSNKKIKRVIL